MSTVEASQARAAVTNVDQVPARERRPESDPAIRVLHLLPDVAIGGGQRIVLHHLRHRDRSRFDVRVATLLGDDGLAPEYVDAGCPPLHLGYDRSSLPSVVLRLTRLLRRERIDVLHVHSDIDRKVGQLAALLAGVPVVGHLHSEWDHFGVRLPEGAGRLRRLKGEVAGRLRDSVERRTVRHYIAESVAVKRLFAPLVDVPITVMQQAVATDRIVAALAEKRGEQLRAQLGLSPETPVLLNVSRMVDGKGQGELVEVMARLADRGLPGVLVLAGDGDRRPQVEDAVERLGLQDRVHLLGRRLDIPDVLAMADIFVFASETEGFGLAVLEAMAASLHVVAFRLPALEEFSVDDVTAHLVDLGDLAGFTDAVAALLAEPARASLMGSRGQALVQERFSPASVARSFEPVYESVASHGGRRHMEVGER